MKFVVLTVAFLFWIVEVFSQEISSAQGLVSGSNRPLASSLAVGGMVQGLLDMQIRPQGGFFEEKYKKIFFHDVPPLPLSLPNTLGQGYISDNFKMASMERVSQDGRLLKEAYMGDSPNPCFETDRILHNRLLGLVCMLQLRGAWNR